MRLLNSAVFGVAAFGCLGFVFVCDAVAQPATFADPCQYSGNPVPCDEDVASMGTYRIRIDNRFVDLFDGCNYYVDCHDEDLEYPREPWAARVLTSPTLYDSNTIIGRSAPHPDGDPVFDTGVGTQVGADPLNLVADSDFDLVPPGFEGPLGTSEVHTEILSLNMTSSDLAAVRAGHPSYLWLNRSVGEVESKTLGPPDFPAESFFNVYVEVDIPACGGFNGGTVSNTSPLVIEADIDSNGFPPSVVYIHGVTNAVPVYFTADDAGGQYQAGDRLGLLVLAGHGVGMGPDHIEEFCLAQDVEDMRTIPTVTEWGLAVMCILLLAAGGVLIRRRRATAG